MAMALAPARAPARRRGPAPSLAPAPAPAPAARALAVKSWQGGDDVQQWANATAEEQWGGWDDEDDEDQHELEPEPQQDEAAAFSEAGGDEDELGSESESDDDDESEAGSTPRKPTAAEARDSRRESVYGISPTKKGAGSPLQQALAFRDGSFARFCRPDTPDADTAKALLIEASDDAWSALEAPESWLSSSPQRDPPPRKSRAKSAGHREPVDTRSIVDKALKQAARAAARRPNSSPGGSQQFALDERVGVDALGFRQRVWGPAAARRHPPARPSRAPAEKKKAAAEQQKKPGKPGDVRLMRWSNVEEEDGGGGRPPLDKEKEEQKDWIKELYRRRQRIAQRGQARPVLDTRIPAASSTKAKLENILGKQDAALAAADAEAQAVMSSGRGNRLWPTQDAPPAQMQWRHPPRTSSAPPRPLLGAKERQAAAFVPAAAHATASLAGATRGEQLSASGLGGAKAMGKMPTLSQRAASAGSKRATSAMAYSGSNLANLTNQVPSGGRPVSAQRPLIHFQKSSIAGAAGGGPASGTAPAVARRSISSTGASTSTVQTAAARAGRPVVVQRGRAASSAVVGAAYATAGSTQQQKRRPVSAGPFYPDPASGGAGAGRRREGGMSESAVAKSVAAEAARRNASLMAMRPTSAASRRPRSSAPKRPLVIAGGQCAAGEARAVVGGAAHGYFQERA